MHWGYWDHPAGMWGMGIGWLFMVLFWVVLIAVVIWLLRPVIPPRGGAPHGQGEASALEILRRRYARGEIDKKEFEEKRRDLE